MSLERFRLDVFIIAGGFYSYCQILEARATKVDGEEVLTCFDGFVSYIEVEISSTI